VTIFLMLGKIHDFENKMLNVKNSILK